MLSLTIKSRIELSKPLSLPKTYYPHFCYDCLFNYFGKVKGEVIPCPNCGGKNVTDYRGCGLIDEETNC